MKTLTSGPSTYQPEKPARARHGAVPAAFCAALLVLQPVVFFWHVLVNPRWHIPYDIEGFHLPLIAYVAQCVRNGVAPLWDPYVMCGMPIHADLQAQVFYPFTWLAILAGNLSQGRNLFYWVETLVPLHMILAGLFAFWLLRRMGLGRPAALMGASVYQLGGYFASQAQHLCAISTGAWLPLAMLCAWELRLRVKWRWVAVLALTMAMAILSGFAATAVIVGVAVLFFMGALFVTREADWRMIPGVGLGCLAGAAIAAVELVPLWTLTNSSIASLRADWYLFGGGLPLASLVSLVLPDYFHIFEFPSLYRAPYQFTFLYTYCGIATVILLAAALFVRQARAIVFLALTVISAVWMLGENTPVYRSIFPHLPRLLRGALYPEYALMAFCFFAAITAAVVLDRMGRRWPVLLWCVALFTSYDLIHTGADRPMNSARGSYRGMDYQATDNKLAEKLRSLAERSYPPSRTDYMDIRYSQGIFGPGMIRVPTPDSNSPFLLLRSWHVRELFSTGHPWAREYAVSRLGSPLLRLLNVAALVGANPIPQEEAARAGLTMVDTVDPYRIYGTAHPLPRFFLAPRLRRSSGAAETLRLLSADSFDPAQEAIVEGIPRDRDGLGAAEVKVNAYGPNRIQLTVRLDRPGYLASSETMYPGWEATVNGAPQPLLMTNGAFRGLALPAGSSRIAMEYRPRSLFYALAISLFALMGTLVAGWRADPRPHALLAPCREAVQNMGHGLRLRPARLAAAIAARRGALASVGMVLVAIGTFYWKVLLTSQFSLLTDAEAVNRSYSRLQFWVFSVRHLTLPLWDPYAMGGQIASGAFYPLHLLLALAPLGADGMLSPRLYHLWFVFAHVLGACFLFALVRELGLERFSALVAAICFSVGGFLGRTSGLDLLESGIWLPLVFLLLLRALRSEDALAAAREAALCGVALGISTLAGGTDMAVLQVLVVISAAIVGSKSAARAALAIVVAGSVGLAAGAVQWLPAWAYGQRSGSAGGELWPQGILTLLMPEAFHGALGAGEVVSPYFGVLPLLLAIVGVWKNWRNAWVRYLCVLAAAGFLVSLGSRSLFYGIPGALLGGLWCQVSSHGLYLVGFSGAILAAFGASTVTAGGFSAEDWRQVSRVFQALLLLSGVALVWLAVQPNSVVNSGMAFSAMTLAATYGIFRWVTRTGASARVRCGAMLVLILFDLNGFESLLKNRQEADRAGANQLDRLLSLRGVAQFLHWQHDPVRAETAPGVPNLGDAFRVEIDGRSGAVSPDLRNMAYRVTPASASEPGAIYTDPFWKIYQNPFAYPRAWMVHQVVYEHSREGQLARLRSAGFEPRKTAALDGWANIESAASSPSEWITWHSAAGGRLELEVDAKRAGLLVLSERFNNGWSASVDGSSARLLRADGELQAIMLPRGNHQVVIKFRPWLFYLGALFTLAGLAAPVILKSWRGLSAC